MSARVPPPDARPPQQPGESAWKYRRRLKAARWCPCEACARVEPWRGRWRAWRNAGMRASLALLRREAQ